jgi:hypothetical protein
MAPRTFRLALLVDDLCCFRSQSLPAPSVCVRLISCVLGKSASACKRLIFTFLTLTSRARLVLIMSERQPRRYDDIARKWHALAERRRAYLADLRDSGRWRRYYQWEDILEAVREAADARDIWARLAGLPDGETPDPETSLAAEAAADGRGEVIFFRRAG